MSVSSNSSSRRASLDNPNLPEVQESYLDSSRSTSPENDIATSTISSQAQAAPYEEPESIFVKIVKDAFRKVFGYFGFCPKKVEPSLEPAVNVAAQDKEVALPGEAELDSPNALLEPLTSEAPVEASESHENEAPAAQGYDEEVESNSAKAFCETDPTKISQALLRQESDGSSIDKSSLDIVGDNEVFEPEAAASNSSESSSSSEAEDKTLTHNQIFILEGLTQEERSYFSKNASKKRIERILERAESSYITVMQAQLRRYQNLPLSDRLTLALRRSRVYLKEQFQKVNSK